MLNNITNFFNLIATRKIKTITNTSDLLPLGTRDPRYTGCYQPTAILACDLINQVITCVPSIMVLGTGCCSTVRCGNSNTASGDYSTTSGGHQNSAIGAESFIGGGRCNTASGFYSTISGGYSNAATAAHATISGGYNQTASGDHSFIGGGSLNTASAACSAILGGTLNFTNCNTHAMIVGSNITANRACSTFVNNLNIMNIPTAPLGLPTKSVWFDSATCTLKMVP